MALATVSTGLVAVGSPREPAVALVGAPVGFTPLQLPGLKLWLDASQITGLVDGDPVATWSDLSGNGNHATQATGSKRPTYKVNIVNGRPVVRPDVVDDILDAANGDLPQPNTVFVVASVNDNAASKNLFATATGAKENTLFFSSTEVLGAYAGSSLNGSGSQVGAFHVCAVEFNTTASKLFVDGVQNGATGTVSTQVLGPFRLFLSPGGSGPFSGDLAEVIVCAGLLSTSNFSRTTRYLGQKYNLAVTA